MNNDHHGDDCEARATGQVINLSSIYTSRGTSENSESPICESRAKPLTDWSTIEVIDPLRTEQLDWVEHFLCKKGERNMR